MTSYVYQITFLPTNEMYIGSRKTKLNPVDDLFKKYFTSSKIVKELVKKHGIDTFEFKVIKEFVEYPHALEYERSLHILYNVVENPLYLNRGIAGERFFTRGPRTDETKEKIRSKLKGRPNPRKGKILDIERTDEYRNKMSNILKGRPKNWIIHPQTVKTSLEMPYTWYNNITRETFIGNRQDLKKHDSSVGVPELKFVIDKKYKSHRNWTII